MGQFIKFVFATIIGLILFTVLVIFVFASILASSVSDLDKTVSDNSVLKINIDKHIEERESDDFFAKFRGAFGNSEDGIGLLELRQSIKKAAKDSKIKGIFLELHDTHTGFAVTEELRNELIEFKKSGKFLIAYADSYSEISYYLASVADRIFLPSSGDLEFNGINVEMMYFKGTLQKLGIQPEIFKVGQYKSAVEPFTNDKMSDANRAQTKSFIGSLYNYYLQKVADARKLNVDSLKQISENMLVRNPDDALKYKLITDIGYYDEATSVIKKKLGVAETEKVHVVSYASYKKDLDEEGKDDGDNDKSDKIAVIFASGDIHSGKGEASSIGSESLASEIRKARLDDKVKAIVLRVNSPGGSALASDVIWREVILAKKVKPVVASMSDVAASGGYYISMAADAIVADPTTITGSIGVFGLLFNMDGFLKDKLGITTDREATGKFSGMETVTRELTPEEKDIMQKSVERIYLDFTGKAAQGRNMTVDSIHAVAQGRVWTALEAKQIGLVDELGGLDDAIALAAKKAKITTYKKEYLPEQKNFILKELINQLDDEESSADELTKLYPYLKSIKNIQNLQGIQARMPYELSVH